MIINIIWLVILIGLESTIGLPLFFLYLADRFFGRYGEKWSLFGVFILALFLAVFYALSWPVLSTLLFVWYFIRLRLEGNYLWLFLLYISLQVIFYLTANLTWHYFYFLHFFAFTWFYFKTNLRKYAH